MEASFLLMGAVIMLSLSPMIRTEDEFSEADNYMNVDESSPSRLFFQNAFRRSPIEQMQPRDERIDVNDVEQYRHWADDLNGNRYIVNLLRRLEIKFDNILNAVYFEEDCQMLEVMNKLETIHRYISNSDENTDKISQTNLIEELIAGVGSANQKLSNIALDFDKVRTDFAKSMRALEKVEEMVEHIDQRTVRIHNESPRRQQISLNPEWNEREIGSISLNSLTTETSETQSQSNENDIILGNSNPSFTTMTAKTQTQMNDNDVILGDRNPSVTIEASKTRSQLNENDVIVGNNDHSLTTTTTKTHMHLNDNDVIVGKGNPSDTTISTKTQSKFIQKDVGDNIRNHSVAANTTESQKHWSESDISMGTRNPSVTTTSTKTKSKLNEMDVSVGKSNPSLTATKTQSHQTTQTTAITKVVLERTYRNLRKDTTQVSFEPNKYNCHDLKIKKNGIYKFASETEVANEAGRFYYERYCDFHTDGIAWTVIQRRFASDRKESFNRTWLEYKNGFGTLNKEFWYGNDFIHKLTLEGDMELRIVYEDIHGKRDLAEYTLFKVKSEAENYKLMIGNFHGTASIRYHNGLQFSTYDRENNNKSCASLRGQGGWFQNCQVAGSSFLKASKMMVRPKRI